MYLKLNFIKAQSFLYFVPPMFSLAAHSCVFWGHFSHSFQFIYLMFHHLLSLHCWKLILPSIWWNPLLCFDMFRSVFQMLPLYCFLTPEYWSSFVTGHILTPISLNLVHLYIFHLIPTTFLKTQLKSFNSGALHVKCYNLNAKCSPEAHMFEHLVIRWWCHVGRGGGALMAKEGDWGRLGGFIVQNHFLFRLLLKCRCTVTHGLLLLSLCFAHYNVFIPLSVNWNEYYSHKYFL